MSNTMMVLTDLYKVYGNLGPKEVILDVRRPEEFAEGHIPKAINVPVDQLGTRSDELKQYSKIYIHCKRGGRAQTALATLSQQGFDNLVCVNDAGMDLWIEKGFPVEN